MVVIKHIRPSVDVPFYQKSEEDMARDKQRLASEGIKYIYGVGYSKKGLKKIEILFFSQVEWFEKWLVSQTVFGLIDEFNTYNETHGIVGRVVKKRFAKLDI